MPSICEPPSARARILVQRYPMGTRPGRGRNRFRHKIVVSLMRILATVARLSHTSRVIVAGQAARSAGCDLRRAQSDPPSTPNEARATAKSIGHNWGCPVYVESGRSTRGPSLSSRPPKRRRGGAAVQVESTRAATAPGRRPGWAPRVTISFSLDANENDKSSPKSQSCRSLISMAEGSERPLALIPAAPGRRVLTMRTFFSAFSAASPWKGSIHGWKRRPFSLLNAC